MVNILTNDLKAQLQQKERELYSIQKIGQALSSTLHLDELLNLIMKEITVLMNADRSTLYLVDKHRKEIWSKIALKAEIKEIRQKFGVGISGYVAEKGEKINIINAYKDPRFDPSTDKRTGYRTRSILCIPVWEPTGELKSRQILGVIQVLNKKEGYFTPSDESILEAIASEVAIAISNAQLYQQLEKKYREIDLLYEYEKKISSEFDLQIIFKNMLSSLIEDLHVNQSVLIYPSSNQFYFLSLKHNGEMEHHPLPPQDMEWIVKAKNDGKADQGTVDENVQIRIKDWIQEDFVYTKMIPLNFNMADENCALLLLKEIPHGEDLYKGDDLQIIDIIGQKISRAIELHNLRGKLLKQERLSAVGQMMSTIVHDLRGPVNNINGFLDLLLEEEVSPEEKEEFAQIMRSEIQSITNMTTEILDFAKGKTSILPRKSSATDIFKRFKPQIEQLFRDSKINLQVENLSKKFIYIDLDKFCRVLYNIAKNAKEAMPNKGNFSLKCSDLVKEVLFELSDDGPGIPEDIRENIFESFVTSGKESGTGLGLAIVKKIVEEHKGEIELKSEVGKGTTFLIKIPEFKMDK
jgi:signal transduction histidine kinase/putative methionine-R-sulfoxide reductase with GAF domain